MCDYNEMSQLAKAVSAMKGDGLLHGKEYSLLDRMEGLISSDLSKASALINQGKKAEARGLIEGCRKQIDALKPHEHLLFGSYYMPDWVQPTPDKILAPIMWEVLAKEGTNVLLLAKNSLAWTIFGGDSFGDSDIYDMLNGEWYESWFTREEKLLIKQTRLPKTRNPVYGDELLGLESEAKPTDCRLFFISVEEAVRYFANYKVEDIPKHVSEDDILELDPTLINSTILFGGFDLDSQLFIEAEPNTWWLRTHGEYEGDFAVITKNRIELKGMSCLCDELGVRPAMWIDTGRLNLLFDNAD